MEPLIFSLTMTRGNPDNLCHAAARKSAAAHDRAEQGLRKLIRSRQPVTVIRTLTNQLADLKRRHREEIRTLQQALETAHGENLELRCRL